MANSKSISPSLLAARLCKQNVPTLTSRQESNEARVVLNEEDPDILNLVIRWLYTGSYDTAEPVNGDDARLANDHPQHQEYIDEMTLSQVTSHLGVYLCADRFFLDKLQTSIRSRLIDVLFETSNRSTSDKMEAAFLDRVFESTSRDDDLRRGIIEKFFRGSGRSSRPAISEVIKRHEPSMWKLGAELAMDKSNAVAAMYRLQSLLSKPCRCSFCGKCVARGCSVPINFFDREFTIDCPGCHRRQWDFQP
jgi:hypothetical protein